MYCTYDFEYIWQNYQREVLFTLKQFYQNKKEFIYILENVRRNTGCTKQTLISIHLQLGLKPNNCIIKSDIKNWKFSLCGCMCIFLQTRLFILVLTFLLIPIFFYFIFVYSVSLLFQTNSEDIIPFSAFVRFQRILEVP